MLYLTTNVILGQNKFEKVIDKKVNKITWLAEQQSKSQNLLNRYDRNFRNPIIEDLNNKANLLNLNVIELNSIK